MHVKQHGLFFILLLLKYIVVAQSWVQISDFPGTERDDGISFVIGNKAYCGTGFKTGWVPCGDMYSFDMDKETWNTISALPQGMERQYATAFSYKGSGFVFGGVNDLAHFNDLWMYDTATGNWQAKTPLPAEGRLGACSFVVNDTAYVIGGRTISESSISEIWAYCITSDTWIFKGNFPFGERWRASAVSLNGKGYLVFGKDAASNNRTELYEFDPIKNSWKQIGDFPDLGRVYSAMNGLGEDLYVAAGLDSNLNSYNDLWRFNLTTSSWQKSTSIPAIERRGGMNFNSGSTLYYTAGIGQTHARLKETWKVFNPSAIFEYSIEKQVSIFPNPASEKISIELQSGNSNIEALALKNAWGQTVKTIDTKDFTNNKIEIDLLDLSKGLYFLQVHFQGNVVVKKFCKE